MKLLCTFSQASNFKVAEIYEIVDVVRCGIEFKEVKGDNGIQVPLVSDGSSEVFISAYFGSRLMADFIPCEEQ